MNAHERQESDLMVNGRQVRAARAWLGWSQQDLADASRVAKRTVIRIEQDDAEAPAQARTLIDVRRALEEAGVTFLFSGQLGVGIAAREMSTTPR